MKRQVTRSQLVEFLLSLRGATFATFAVETDARAKKRGNPFGPIRKRAEVNGQLNFHYDAAVLRRLEKEGKGADAFEQGESWHEAVKRPDGTLTPLARHKSKADALYVRFRYLAHVAGPAFFDVAGKPLDAEAVKPHLPAPSTYANQGTDDPVIFLTYGLDSIREVRTEGETLIVTGD